MKYNIDCVRAVLLCLEDELKIIHVEENAYKMQEIYLPRLLECLGQNYSEPDIIYSVKKLDEAGYITANFSNDVIYADDILNCDYCSISSITYNGHEFLENIREDKNWKKIKNAGKAASSFALSIVGEIAKNIALGAAQTFLDQNGLPQ